VNRFVKLAVRKGKVFIQSKGKQSNLQHNFNRQIVTAIIKTAAQF